MHNLKKIFVFDTNVLLIDPAAIYRFMEHDIFVPMTVLEELDAAKKGVSDLARSAREVSRRLDGLIKNATPGSIESGIALHETDGSGPDADTNSDSGRLLLQTFSSSASKLPASLPGNSQDNQILAAIVTLKERAAERQVILLTNDINLRIKAHVLGIQAEDYYNDKFVDDSDVLFSGYGELTNRPQPIENSDELLIPELGQSTFYPNEGLYLVGPPNKGDNHESKKEAANSISSDYLVSQTQSTVTLRPTISYFAAGKSVWGINARNREQNFALNLLMDPAIDFVTLLGAAGTGKTLLALAAGLAQTLEDSRYQEIIVTRETISLGEDIGFLPGTEEEKMTPWMGALVDNLEVLNESPGAGAWGKAATLDLLHNRIKVRSMGFMRGRTFTNRYVIVDEAQNMTAKQMRAVVSRAGPGTKLVCLGNIAQIDSPYLSEANSGLTYVVKKFRAWPYSGHITLQQGERSRLAEFAATYL